MAPVVLLHVFTVMFHKFRKRIDNFVCKRYNVIVMKDKVTLRDIAKEAGVSVATASYVLNNRDDQCISQATRNKILQVVNLHGYKLNFSAKRISSGRSNIVALYFGEHTFGLHKAEHLLLIDRLSAFLAQNGLSLSVVSDNKIARLDYCDAIICCETDVEFFDALGNANFCPLIALNTVVDNTWLFYQINTDFQKVRRIADEIYGNDYCVVSFPVVSNRLKERITNAFEEVVFADNYEVLDKLADKNLVVLGETLEEYCKRFAKDILTIDIFNAEKLSKLLECIDITVNRKESVNHDIRI